MDNLNEESAALPSATDRLVERWWEDHFPGSAVARDTRAWNIAIGAKETLKRLLAGARDLRQAGSGEKESKGSN